MASVQTDPNSPKALATTTRLRHLAEQLSLEYAGAVAPGRVLRLALTTGHRLRRQGYTSEDLLRLTKASVRADLTTLIGTNLSTANLALAAG